MALSFSQCMGILVNLGYRVDSPSRRTQAVRDFQRGWNLGSALAMDGVIGPATNAALAISEQRRRAGLGTISAHFSHGEFRCKCGGRYADCRRTWISRLQVQRLEAYRLKVGPVQVVSGCRCPGHNAAVGGASSSQHLSGNATDVAAIAHLDKVRSWRLFTGLGYKGSTGKVTHVDSRTTATTASPTVWRYAT